MKLFMHSAGSEAPELIEIEASARVRELMAESEPDAAIWLEEIDEEIDPELTLEEAGIGQHSHVHRGRCRKIEVVVRYNGNRFRDTFRPAAKVKRVERWASKTVGLSPEEAAKHVLAVPGADHFLEGGVHVGSLVIVGSCELVLDLLPRDRFEG